MNRLRSSLLAEFVIVVIGVLVALAADSGMDTTFDASTAALENLMSTGGLDLLEDSELRNAVLVYSILLRDAAEVDALQRASALDTSARLAPQLVGGFAWHASFSYHDGGGSLDTARAEASTALDAEAIRESGVLRELLVATAQLFVFQRVLYDRIVQNAEDLSRTLQSALEARPRLRGRPKEWYG